MKQLSINITKKLGYLMAVFVVLMAVLVIASRLIIPVLDEHKPDIEAWASDLLHAPVAISKVRVSWYKYEPVISLDQVTILDKQSKQPAMQIRRVRILFSLPKSLWHKTPVLSGIVIAGTEVILKESKQGGIAVQGFPTLGGYSDQPYSSEAKFANILEWTSTQPRLILNDIDIRYTNKKNIKRFITLYELDLENTETHHSVSGKAILHQDLPTEVKVVANWQGTSSDLAHLKAKAYFYISGFSIAQWLKGYSWNGWHINKGMTGAKVWVTWQGGALQKIQTLLTAYDVELYSENDKTTHQVARLSGDFGWKEKNGEQIFAANDFLLDLPHHLWPATNFHITFKVDATGKLIPKAINLGYVDLYDIQSFLFSFPGLITQESKKIIKELHLTGNLEKAAIVFAGPLEDLSHISLNADFAHLTFAARKKFLGVKNLSGNLTWDGQIGDLSLLSHHTTFQLDSVFSQPITLSECTGKLEWQKTVDNELQIKFQNVEMQNEDIFANINGALSVSEKSGTTTAINGKFSVQRANRIIQYLPTRILDEELVSWLQQAILSGQVRSGTATIRGKLKDFPFENNNGEFLVTGNVKKVNLRYAPDWPILTNLSGTLTFSGRQMLIDIDEGKTEGIALGKIHAIIPHLGGDKPEVLEVQSQTIKADFSQGLAFVHKSPLEKTIGKMFESAELQGPMKLKLNLTVPLSAPDNTKVQGEIDINDAILNMAPWNLKVEHLFGQVEFTETSTSANALKGMLFSKPLTFSLKTLQHPKSTSVVQANLTTQLDTADLAAWLKIPFSNVAKGSAGITGSIDFSLQAPIVVRLASDLQGMELDLPDQYSKPANAVRNFVAEITIQAKQPLRMKISYGDLLGAGLALERKQDEFKLVAANLSLGKGPVNVPTQSGLFISGQIPEIDWDKIKSYSNQSNAKSFTDLELRNIDVLIDKINLAGQNLTNTRVQLTPNGTAWQLAISNSQMAGQITLPAKMTRQSSVSAQFQRLNLQASSEEKNKTQIDVKSLPAITFVANNLSYNTIPIGAVSFKTVPSDKGLTIKDLTIESNRINLKASGDWSQANLTRLQGTVTSPNVSAFLSGLGFDVHNLVFNKGRVDFNLSWQDAPYSLSLAKLNGDAAMDLGKGRIVEVSQTSGAKMDLGRMLSIFSLQTIPRRLSFDFSDVFQKGYSFDNLRGEFNFDDGDVYTNNTRFDGPVARVSINGRIGLAEKDYDLTLSVTPYVTSSIPVAATLLTGQPLIGIAAFAVNRVIGSEVSKVTTYYYAVRGPWSNPNWDSITPPRR